MGLLGDWHVPAKSSLFRARPLAGTAGLSPSCCGQFVPPPFAKDISDQMVLPVLL